MWWKVTIGILILVLIFVVLGLYAGGLTYLFLTKSDTSFIAWNTLIEAGKISLTDRQKIFIPWSWCVTIAIVFSPLVITGFVMFGGKGNQNSLHGNARFANNRELRLFKYDGNYK